MNFTRIAHLSQRVIRQIVADRRSLLLILFVPVLLLTVAGVLIRQDQQPLQVGVVAEAAPPAEALLARLNSLPEIEAQALSAQQAEEELADGALDAVLRWQSSADQPVLQVEYEGTDPARAALSG
ncbi:MAG: hypothetical protein HC915_08480, partial [Anaerolineae bacterium]|nr:hypothetical protein [Anaerolineae bacterium]